MWSVHTVLQYDPGVIKLSKYEKSHGPPPVFPPLVYNIDLMSTEVVGVGEVLAARVCWGAELAAAVHVSGARGLLQRGDKRGCEKEVREALSRRREALRDVRIAGKRGARGGGGHEALFLLESGRAVASSLQAARASVPGGARLASYCWLRRRGLHPQLARLPLCVDVRERADGRVSGAVGHTGTSRGNRTDSVVGSQTLGGAALWAGGADLCLVTLVTPVHRSVSTEQTVS